MTAPPGKGTLCRTVTGDGHALNSGISCGRASKAFFCQSTLRISSFIAPLLHNSQSQLSIPTFRSNPSVFQQGTLNAPVNARVQQHCMALNEHMLHSMRSLQQKSSSKFRAIGAYAAGLRMRLLGALLPPGGEGPAQGQELLRGDPADGPPGRLHRPSPHPGAPPPPLPRSPT